VLKELSARRGRKAGPLPSPRQNRSRQQNSLLFDVRTALFALPFAAAQRTDAKATKKCRASFRVHGQVS
jgi:hypothetical protein